LFDKKRLLIVAGPTGCGKSTFLKSALGNKPSPLAKKILKKAFKRSDFKIQQLYFRRLQKSHEKQERFEKFTNKHNNFILDVDTTGPKFKKNAEILTNFLAEFNYITSIQIYTPYEVWLNRILERKIYSSLKGSRSIRRVLHKSFSLKLTERDRARETYNSYYDRWESILSNHKIDRQLRISTIQGLILE